MGVPRCVPGNSLLISGLDGSGAVHTVFPWEVFGGHAPPPGGLNTYIFKWMSGDVELAPGGRTAELRDNNASRPRGVSPGSA